MAYKPQQYFRYNDSDAAEGLVIVDADDDHYRVTEKFSDGWHKPFWMPVSEFKSHMLELAGKLPSDKFKRVCKAADPELLEQ